MPLSEHEQKLLEQLEQQLNADDPHFASSMSSERTVQSSSYSVRNIVLGILILLVGISVVIAGVASKLVVLGVLGFLVAAGGIYLATIQNKKPITLSSKDSHHSDQIKKQSNFMQTLEDRWDERRNQGL